VPRCTLCCRTRTRIGVVAGIVNQNSRGLVCRAPLRVARSDVVIIARCVVEDAKTLEVPAALTEFTDGVAIISGEIVDGPDAAGSVAANSKTEALTHSGEYAWRFIDAGEMRPVRGIGFVAGSVDDETDAARPAHALREDRSLVEVISP